MHPTEQGQTGFKRQVVVRVGQEDWPLLEAAVQEHGSIQAAILAGLHALTPVAETPTSELPAANKKSTAKRSRPANRRNEKSLQAVKPPTDDPAPETDEDADEEITARHAAQLLGLETSTVRGYIRSGRLAGHNNGAGWFTTRGEVGSYRRRSPQRRLG